MKNKGLCLLAVFVFLGFFCGKAFSAEKDLLIDKLVEKKVLTEEEARQLSADSKTSQHSVPEWLENLKLSGDLRIRYQYEDKDTAVSGATTNAQRERARFRFRLGFESEVAEGWAVQAGLATGSSDPRSTNQTFQDNSSSKDIKLDHAFAEYDPHEKVTAMAGKIKGKKILWAPSQLVWDSDINPEGVLIKIKCADTGIWLNTGYFILDEISAGADPSIFYIQPGIKLDFEKDIELKGAFNYYSTNSVKGLDYTNIVSGSGTNSTATTPASFVYDYDCWGVSAELAKYSLIEGFIEHGAIFLDYINNPDPENEDTGYLVGLKFGDHDIKEAKQWQFRTTYRELEKDAWLDFLTHSDFLGGKTDAKGYSAALRYGITGNVILGMTYYDTETIKSPIKEEEELLQIDCSLKF